MIARIKNSIRYRKVERELLKRADVAGNQEIFFIVSAGRSGSTLLRKHLMGSEDVGIPPETENFIPKVANIWLTETNFDSKIGLILETVKKMSCFSFWTIDWTKLEERLRSLRINDRKLANVIWEFYKLGTDNKVIVGDKTPYLVYYLDWLKAIFPNMKLIYLIRDGRAVVNSYIQTRGYDLKQACDRWNASVNSFVKSKIYTSNDYFLVKYENFVLSPKLELEKICGYLNIPYTDSILNPEGIILGDGHLSHHQNVVNKINDKSIHKWRDEIEKDDVEVINKLLIKNMKDFYSSV